MSYYPRSCHSCTQDSAFERRVRCTRCEALVHIDCRDKAGVCYACYWIAARRAGNPIEHPRIIGRNPFQKDTMTSPQPQREISPGNHFGDRLRIVWELVEVLRDKEAFSTSCGMTGRSVLDYPGGFRFTEPPINVTDEYANAWGRPGVDVTYKVWSQHGSMTYTIAWFASSSLLEDWIVPRLHTAPTEVQWHQWLIYQIVRSRHPALPLGLDMPGSSDA
jgi:hypothetical protein